MQLLGGGGAFVGWGGSRFATEFDRSGRVVFDASLPPGGQSYRAFRFPWAARPAEPPAARARGRTLYASWNGATGVASWQLVEDERATQTVPRSGFETQLRPGTATRRVAAVALDDGGRPLGRSATIEL
jgi:hypothetical protein